MRSAHCAASVSEIGSLAPGTTATPANAIFWRAVILSPIARMTSPVGTDEAHAGSLAPIGEVGVLGQKSVTRMDRIGARALRDFDHAFGDQIRIAGGCRSARIGGIGEADVQRLAVSLGVDRDGRDLQLATSAHHANRDLASICDQYLLKHSRIVPWPLERDVSVLPGRR